MIVFEMPAPAELLSLNDRIHWSKRRQREGLWKETTYYHAVKYVPRSERPREGRSLVRVTLPCRSMKTRRDPHNFIATVKPIVDGLTLAGLWPDDTSQWVKVEEPTFWTNKIVLVEISRVAMES